MEGFGVWGRQWLTTPAQVQLSDSSL